MPFASLLERAISDDALGYIALSGAMSIATLPEAGLGQPLGWSDIAIFLSTVGTSKDTEAEDCLRANRGCGTSGTAVRAYIEICGVYRRGGGVFSCDNKTP